MVLTRFEAPDAAAVLEAFADPDIQRWNLRRFDDVDEVEGWIVDTHDAWTAETSATWAIRASDAGDGGLLGRVTVYLRLAEGQGEVTYWVAPDARGTGVAPRAVGAVTTWAHGVVGLERVELEHSTHNLASCRVAEKAGYAVEGTRRRARLHGDGWHDMHLHAHVKERSHAARGRSHPPG